MIEALNLDKILRVVEEYPHDRIIGVLFARYDTSKELIEPNYTFWDTLTSQHLDIFLAGYGAYLRPDEQTSRKRIISFSESNDNRIYFDDDAFISIVNKIKSELKSFKYDDSIPLLVLLDTVDGSIIWNKPIIIKIKDSSHDYILTKSLIYKVSELTSQFNYLSDIWGELKRYEIRKRITNFVTFSDVIALIALLEALKN